MDQYYSSQYYSGQYYLFVISAILDLWFSHFLICDFHNSGFVIPMACPAHPAAPQAPAASAAPACLPALTGTVSVMNLSFRMRQMILRELTVPAHPYFRAEPAALL